MRLKSTGVTRSHMIGLVAGAGLLLAPAFSQAQSAYTISTIAGTGTGGFSGDGGPANVAQVYNPCALLADNSGNLYIGDSSNYRVRKMQLGGNINTVVGTGTAGDTVGAATSSQIRNPCGLLLDRAGNLYLSDTTNNEVKKVTTSGTLSIFAGSNSTAGYIGDGAAANLAELHSPIGLAVDAAGNIYIADSGNNVVRMVGSNGAISTIVGDGTGGYYGDGGAAGAARINAPTALAIDAAGNLYIADTGNSVIRKVSPAGNNGIITTYAGNGSIGFSGDGGLATQAALGDPKGIALDQAGNLYIADTVNNRIRVVNPANGIITTIGGSGAQGAGGDGGIATQAQFNFPQSIVVDSLGNLYVADSGNSEVRMMTPGAINPGLPPSINGVISASEFGHFPAMAPGSWIEIYGSNLAIDSRQWNSGDFNGPNAPKVLDGTYVTIGGQRAFVSAVSSGQVNVQVPSSVGPGPQQLTLTTNAGTSAPITVTVNATEPGLYAPAALLVGGKQYTAVFNGSTTFVMPAGAVSGLVSRPARPGDIINLFGSGFGPVTPNIDAGLIVQQCNPLATPVQVTIGGVPAGSTACLAPSFVGLYQINVVVPNVAAGSAVPLTFSQGGTGGTQTLYIAVGN